MTPDPKMDALANLAACAVAFLRADDQDPKLTCTESTPQDTVNALWNATLGDVLAAPDWTLLATVEHLGSPVTVLRAGIPGHPGLTLIAALVPLAGQSAVTLATARMCTTDPSRHAIRRIAWPGSLALALRHNALDADLEHGDCHPAHELFAVARLNNAEPHRERAHHSWLHSAAPDTEHHRPGGPAAA